MWLYATGYTDIPIFLYDYRTTRASKNPQKMLKGFKGYLHTDGYSGYNDITGAKVVGCFAHARRKFTDALKSMPKDSSSAATSAQEGLNFCNRLFDIERNLEEKTHEHRYEGRLEQSKSILDEFYM